MTLRLFIVHNDYIHAGGEEACVDQEIQALQRAKQQVTVYRVATKHGIGSMLKALAAPVGQGAERALENALQINQPDILHAHNLYPLLSPRIFKVARRREIKTVLTLHNYRPLCLNGLFLTPQLEICERCPQQYSYQPGIVRGCYRENRIQSFGLATHLRLARDHGWYDAVDRFVAPCEFLKQKYTGYGFPEEKITVQGHFIADAPDERPAASEPYLLYMGRLSPEKGIPWILQMFQRPALPFRLKIAGAGPLEKTIRSQKSPHIDFLGFIKGREKQKAIRRATALVMPSECFENFPLAIAESNGWGVPALAPHQGGFAEMIQSGRNGETYRPKDASDFWESLQRLTRQGMALRIASQTHAQSQFSQASFVKKRLALYEGLLDSRQNALI